MARFEDIDVADLIEFGKAWRGLGDSVADQVEAVLNDADSWSEQNPNALRLAQERIGGFHEEIDEALQEALDEFEAEDNEEHA